MPVSLLIRLSRGRELIEVHKVYQIVTVKDDRRLFILTNERETGKTGALC